MAIYCWTFETSHGYYFKKQKGGRDDFVKDT